MRNELTGVLIERFKLSKFTFITGDLGFMAFESLKSNLGEYFINIGISEQNMVSVGASIANEGLETWIYSIAPFLYGRSFEQIRNDVCFHNIAVKLIGNGGGYSYGVMGPSHHSIEDYGVLLTLPNINVYIPAFTQDIEYIINIVGQSTSPSYIRLSTDDSTSFYEPPEYKNWRHLIKGNGNIIIVVGSLASLYVEEFLKVDYEKRPNLWVICKLPINISEIPTELLDDIKLAKVLYLAEEHVVRGGVGSEILFILQTLNISLNNFIHFYAQKHIFDYYGSQKYLRAKSGLNCENILSIITEKY